MSTGCILGWSSPTLPKILGYGEKIHVTREEGAWLSSVVTLGAVFGSFFAGALIDRIGRKWTIITLAFIEVISWFLMVFCSSIYLLYIARVIAGCGIGSALLAVPIYITEISPVRPPYSKTTFYHSNVINTNSFL